MTSATKPTLSCTPRLIPYQKSNIQHQKFVKSQSSGPLLPKFEIKNGGRIIIPILSSSASGPVPSTTPSAGLPYLPHPTLSNEPIATACVLPPAVSSPTLNVGSTTFATAPTTGHLFYPSLLQFSTPSPPSAPPPGLRLVLPER